MNKNKLDRKYYPLIWAALVLSSIIANIYGLYLTFTEIQGASLTDVLTIVFRIIFSYGLIPTALCFVFAMIIYGIGARSYLLAVPRNDFIYIVMIFTAAARLLCGIIDAFCIIVPAMSVVTSTILAPLIETIAYAIMFFAVFARRYNMNPAEKFNSFRVWAFIYFILLGIAVVIESFAYIMLYVSDNLRAMVNELIADVYGVIVKSELDLIASIVALSMYALFVIGAVIIGAVLKKNAKNYVAPETRGEYFDTHPNNPYVMRDDVHDTYGEFGATAQGENGENKENNSKDDKVFDEFDI